MSCHHNKDEEHGNGNRAEEVRELFPHIFCSQAFRKCNIPSQMRFHKPVHFFFRFLVRFFCIVCPDRHHILLIFPRDCRRRIGKIHRCHAVQSYRSSAWRGKTNIFYFFQSIKAIFRVLHPNIRLFSVQVNFHHRLPAQNRVQTLPEGNRTQPLGCRLNRIHLHKKTRCGIFQTGMNTGKALLLLHLRDNGIAFFFEPL